jgi:peroxiredoxin
VKEWARAIRLPGAVAVDRDWAVLKRWTAGKKYDFTSLTFLLDGRGRIRHVHSGGVISEKDADDLGRRIEALRAEKD